MVLRRISGSGRAGVVPGLSMARRSVMSDRHDGSSKSMIPNSGNRFSDQIMLNRKATTRKRAAPPSGPQARDLLAWYDRHRRVLPWRAKPGEAIDPYRVWLSEIMLQQTTVKAVAPYFARFVARWPDVGALASAPLDDVLRLWAGLGYYARARNLHACARAVAERGGFPRTETDLTTLPGIGRYTAAAIAAIAFDAPAVPVDGNVERVVTRLFAVEEELPAA